MKFLLGRRKTGISYKELYIFYTNTYTNKKYSEETVYSWDAWQRGQAYHGIKTTGYSVPQGPYRLSQLSSPAGGMSG